MRINPKVKEIVDKYTDISDDILVYLLSLYYKLKPTYIPNNIKRQTYTTNIVNRDFDGDIVWNEPLLVDKQQELLNADLEDMIEQGQKEPVIENNTNNDWIIDEYREMFRTLNNNKAGSRMSVVKKMEMFIKNHPDVTKEDIIKATKLYLSEFEEGNSVVFMKQADYFIYKQELIGGKQIVFSKLEEYLEKLVDVNSDYNLINKKMMRGLR